jgi:Tannase-like family of unknown function (DUF6351)
VIAGGCALVVLLGACSSSSHKANSGAAPTTTPSGGLNVKVVSTRPDMVTGENALLAVEGGAGTPQASANGTALTVKPLKQWWLVTGLPQGSSTIDVTRGALHGSVSVTDTSIKGPVFSGPHMPLLACSTVESGLGPATDADCSAPTKVVSKNVDDPGKTPIAVRAEQGVINRSVYWIDTPKQWNGRLVYRFGGGCGSSFGQGGLLGQSVDAPSFLRDGYAVATATFNTFQTQCNDVLSAETMMMVKEHFIEEFGVPVHTIAEGASGGSIQIHLILQNYPGLIDAAIAELPFPDAISIASGVADCGLLDHYYAQSGAQLSADQRAAINGHAVASTCFLWDNSFLEGIRPSDGCDPAIPKSKIYDATTNPKGIRCDLADGNVNSFGRDAKTGFANRAADNVGVQYGLEALNTNKITVDQFLDLNEDVGGYDVDGNFQTGRHSTTEDVLKIAYGKGRVAEGGGDLGKVPLIDLNLYDDPAGDIHDRFRAFSLRARLQSPSQRIWTRGSSVTDISGVIGNITSGGGGAGDNAVPILDKWLDTGTMPAAAQDNCPGANGTTISGADIYQKPGPCRDNYPLHGDPRTAAGAPLRNDIIKCQLKPIARADYKATLSSAQQTRLEQIFPDGVCDWTKPGVGQVPLEGTWLKY